MQCKQRISGTNHRCTDGVLLGGLPALRQISDLILLEKSLSLHDYPQNKSHYIHLDLIKDSRVACCLAQRYALSRAEVRSSQVI